METDFGAFVFDCTGSDHKGMGLITTLRFELVGVARTECVIDFSGRWVLLPPFLAESQILEDNGLIKEWGDQSVIMYKTCSAPKPRTDLGLTGSKNI